VGAMNCSLIPERPMLVSPSLAASIGLEEATLLGMLSELARLQAGQVSQGYKWYQLGHEQLASALPFWSAVDISRISQSLRAQGVIHLHSAPYSQSQRLLFAFNEQAPAAQPPINTPVQSPPANYTAGAAPIAPNWQPSREVLQLIGQHGIPEAFALGQLPEFVNFWRESGESQRSWGSKFTQQVRRQWSHHQQQQVREERACSVDSQWQPSTQIQEQLHRDGIPVSFISQCLTRFIKYHQDSGTQHHSWDSLFYRWVGDDWNKRETPFMEKKQSLPMTLDWAPPAHTLQYLRENCVVDDSFIRETVAEFIHKWMEKKAHHSEWGSIFAKHVLEQWRFVQAGIERNPTAQLISHNWQPSADCINILVQQAGVDATFINNNIAEFILYWQNRNEARHSWDTSFIGHIKHHWSKNNGSMPHGSQHNLPAKQGYEGQQTNQSSRTKDRSISEQLSDHSWAL